MEDRVQITAANINKGINSPRAIVYAELGWDASSVRRKVHKRPILFHKIVYELVPQYLQDFLKPCFLPKPHIT